ncbi:TIGR03826 family flagellar region protein [Falsibacillus pallidus]|uniref:TIGR03826 family flagellar region protein n=1 Tax=Falsibacillus pallidus TaxID=493781 RepID=UPI003D999983
MAEITNCPTCNSIFAKNAFRDVCDKCFKEEEKQYDTVYGFLRKRENRAATIPTIVAQTGVPEDLIHKFVRKGRFNIAHFPNLGYPCDKCGTIIKQGKICENCSSSLRADLQSFQNEQKRAAEIREKEKATYYSNKD